MRGRRSRGPCPLIPGGAVSAITRWVVGVGACNRVFDDRAPQLPFVSNHHRATRRTNGLAVAGNIDHDEVVALVREHFGHDCGPCRPRSARPMAVKGAGRSLVARG